MSLRALSVTFFFILIFLSEKKGRNAPFLIVLVHIQDRAHDLERVLLAAGIDVRIARGGQVRGVTQVTLDLAQTASLVEEQRSAGVPLRYNYDKPEKPRISRVFGYLARFFILFQTGKSSREVVIS